MDRASSHAVADEDTWVPVEHRLLGIDRLTIPLSLVVIAIVFVAVIVLPAIDNAMKPDNATRPGDLIVVAGAEQITMVPPMGWELDGARKGEAPAVPLPSTVHVSNGSVRVTVKAATFDGSAAELMDRVDDLNSRQDDALGFGTLSQRLDATLASGVTGVVEVYTGLEQKGVIMTFVFDTGKGDRVGVEVIASGDAQALTEQLPAIAAMVDSLTAKPSTGATP